MGWEQAASGYAAVWATENTRAAIWDAMKRKETYATTGPRMTVRFFGGWDFAEADATASDLATTGYDKGVPMGGDLKTAAAGKSPTFLVAAMKDPEGGNLDRIQIIKGWVDAKGARQEKVYDVVWSGDRKPGADGKVPAVGNTVDVPNATYTNTIGAPQLASFWKDPEFDASLRAVYYVRVLEIPTPRWTAYDAKHFKVKMPKEVRDGHPGAGVHLAHLVHAVARKARDPSSAIIRRMTAPSNLPQNQDFSLVLGGPLFQLFRRAHLTGDALEMSRSANDRHRRHRLGAADAVGAGRGAWAR